MRRSARGALTSNGETDSIAPTKPRSTGSPDASAESFWQENTRWPGVGAGTPPTLSIVWQIFSLTSVLRVRSTTSMLASSV